jgi:hypothetical protein
MEGERISTILLYILSSREHIAFATLPCHPMASTTPAADYSTHKKMPLYG